MFLTRARSLLAIGGLALVPLAATKCDPGSNRPDAAARVQVRVAPPKAVVVDTHRKPGTVIPGIIGDNVCALVSSRAVEQATGVSGLLSWTVEGEDGPDGRPVVCRFADPNGPPEAYGTVNFVYDPSQVLAPTATLAGLAGGRIYEPSATDRIVDRAYGGRGRAQTRVSWVFERHPVEVDGRGPAVTPGSMLALAQHIDANLRS